MAQDIETVGIIISHSCTSSRHLLTTLSALVVETTNKQGCYTIEHTLLNATMRPCDHAPGTAVSLATIHRVQVVVVATVLASYCNSLKALGPDLPDSCSSTLILDKDRLAYPIKVILKGILSCLVMLKLTLLSKGYVCLHLAFALLFLS